MFAFIDQQMVVAVIILIGAIYLLYGSMRLDKSNPVNINYFHAMAITAIISIFIVGFSSEQDAIANTIAMQKHHKILECKNNNNLYRVSKEDGWSVDGLYFIKDSLMIRADMCEQR